MRAISEDDSGNVLIDLDDRTGFLPVAAIYGPNGGGKTNMLNAIAYVVSLIRRPVKLFMNTKGDRDNVNLNQGSIFEMCKPFKFDENSSGQPTVFQLYYRVNHGEFRYRVSVQGERIVEESLHLRTVGKTGKAILFVRDEKGISLGTQIRRKRINTEIPDQMPFLSSLAINHKIPVIDDAMQFFLSSQLLKFSLPYVENEIRIFRDNDKKKVLLKMLDGMGIGISDYRVEDTNEKETELTVYTTHTHAGNSYELELSEESCGTIKLFSLLPTIMNSLDRGGLLVVDELDSKLHPLLIRNIINTYKDPHSNPYGAQIIFTTHDIANMNNSVFRRDEIFFACLNEDKASEFYSLYDVRIPETGKRVNATASYGKQYLEGRYGADPYLKKILAWGE